MDTQYRFSSSLKLTLAEAKQHLSVHAHVYACSDRLGIEELRSFACAAFVAISGNDQIKTYSRPWSAEILEFVYKNTMVEIEHEAASEGPGGSGRTAGLRYEATMCVLRNLEPSTDIPENSNIIMEHEPMAWEVAQILKEERARLSARAEQVELELKREQQKSASIQQELELKKTEIKQMSADAHTYLGLVCSALTEFLGDNKKCNSCKNIFRVGTVRLERFWRSRNTFMGTKAIIACRNCAQDHRSRSEQEEAYLSIVVMFAEYCVPSANIKAWRHCHRIFFFGVPLNR